MGKKTAFTKGGAKLNMKKSPFNVKGSTQQKKTKAVKTNVKKVKRKIQFLIQILFVVSGQSERSELFLSLFVYSLRRTSSHNKNHLIIDSSHYTSKWLLKNHNNIRRKLI